MQIELTKEEADALLRLLDVAARSGGLSVAEPVLFFARKISEAAAGKLSAPKLVDKDVA